MIHLASRLGGVRAQIVTFDRTLMPDNFTLHVLRMFYVYAHKDAPEHSASGDPIVRLRGLTLQDAPAGYEGIQVLMMQFEHAQRFVTLEARSSLCCSDALAAQGKCGKDQLNLDIFGSNSAAQDPMAEADAYELVNFTLAANGSPLDVSEVLHRTGIYVLMVSNCGIKTGARMSGTIEVRNPYGFLPANEYHKMPFYGWLALVYLVCGAAWAYLSVTWWKEMVSIQHCISAVICFGLLECLIWYIFYWAWNSSGTALEPVRVLGIFSSGLKSVYTYMLVLVASLGWGVTKPHLEKQTIRRLFGLSVLYLVGSCSLDCMVADRHGRLRDSDSETGAKKVLMAMAILPVSVFCASTASWLFMGLGELTSTLKERKQTAKLQLYNRLWMVIVTLLVVAMLLAIGHMASYWQSIAQRWQRQWLWEDCASHLLFLGLLASIMYLWAPHKYSQRYAYSRGGERWDKEEDTAEPVWTTADSKKALGDARLSLGDEEAEGAEDQDSFWASTKGGSSLTEDALQATEEAVLEQSEASSPLSQRPARDVEVGDTLQAVPDAGALS